MRVIRSFIALILFVSTSVQAGIPFEAELMFRSISKPITQQEQQHLLQLAYNSISDLYPEFTNYSGKEKVAIFVKVLEEERAFIFEHMPSTYSDRIENFLKRENLDDIKSNGSELSDLDKETLLLITEHIYNKFYSKLISGMSKIGFNSKPVAKNDMLEVWDKKNSLKGPTLTTVIVFAISFCLAVASDISPTMKMVGTNLMVLSGTYMAYQLYLTDKLWRKFWSLRDLRHDQNSLKEFLKAYHLKFVVENTIGKCTSALKAL